MQSGVQWMSKAKVIDRLAHFEGGRDVNRIVLAHTVMVITCCAMEQTMLCAVLGRCARGK